MGLEVGGYTDVPDWPKLGPSLLIATCLILAIRTAKWPALTKQMLSESELDREIDFTAERVIIHADTSVHPDLLSSRFGYVAVSRASHEAKLFTDDATRLASQIANNVSKASALEIMSAGPIGEGIENGVA